MSPMLGVRRTFDSGRKTYETRLAAARTVAVLTDALGNEQTSFARLPIRRRRSFHRRVARASGTAPSA